MKIKMKYKKYSFVDFTMTIFAFLVIYRPAITPVIHITDVLFLWSVMGYIILNGGKIKKSDFLPTRYIVRFVILIVAAAIYAGIVTYVSGGKISCGNIYIKMMLYGIVYTGYVISVCKKHGWDYVHVIDWCLQASIIQTVFVILTMLNSEFKTKLLHYLIQNGALGITAERVQVFSQRTFGLADGYFSGLGVVSGIMATMCVILGMKKSVKYYWYIPGLLLTTLVNVRVGFVIFVVNCIWLFVTSKNISVIKKLQLVVILGGIVLLGVGVFSFLEKVAPSTVTWILNLGEHMGMATTEGETAYTYYKLNPLNWKWPGFFETILGTGKSVFGSEGLTNFGYSSDSGYLGIIYRGGIILSVILYTGIYFLCMDEKKNRDDFLRYKFAQVFVIALIIQQYKGGVFYFNEYMTLIIMICVAMNALSERYTKIQ